MAFGLSALLAAPSVCFNTESEAASCVDSRVERSSASQKQPSPAGNEQPAGIATLSDQARKVRLDSLYELLSAAGIDDVVAPGFSTLTRKSLEKIFNRLMSDYGFSGKRGITHLGQLLDRLQIPRKQ